MSPQYLSEEQIQSFHENGFLVIERFWDEEKVKHLHQEIDNVISSIDLSASRSIFTTSNNMQGVNRDKYFLESGDVIRHFWEEKAFDDEGNPVQPLKQCINKIGHALHDLCPAFQEVSYEGRVGSICADLGMSVPTVVQSMYIFKNPHIGGEVTPHQDGTFLYTEPQSVLGFWWALDDCRTSNGCLWAVPGSHKSGVKRRFKRLPPPAVGTEFDPPENVHLDMEGGVPVECPAGSLVLIHHSVVHWSAVNTSDAPRHAYTIHVIDGAEDVVYPADNWLQKSDGSRFNAITNYITS